MKKGPKGEYNIKLGEPDPPEEDAEKIVDNDVDSDKRIHQNVDLVQGISKTDMNSSDAQKLVNEYRENDKQIYWFIKII